MLSIHEFVVEPPTLEIATGWQGLLDLRHAPAAAGGVWEGAGRRKGHAVCWRIAGVVLELSEISLLPGLVVGGDLRLRFATGLLPSLGLVQLPDDSLLLSTAIHAPSGGVFVYQMRFGGVASASALVPGACVRRCSWFDAAPEAALSTPEPVGAALGTSLAVAFEGHADVMGALAWRNSLLLGGEASQTVHVRLEVDLSAAQDIHVEESELQVHRSSFTAFMGSSFLNTMARPVAGAVAGAIGISAGLTSPHEAICALNYVKIDDVLCAITLSRNGALRMWRLCPPGAARPAERSFADGPAHPASAAAPPAPAASALLAVVELGADAPRSASAIELVAGNQLAVWLRAGTLGVCATIAGSVWAATTPASDLSTVAAHLADVRHWAPLHAPSCEDPPASGSAHAASADPLPRIRRLTVAPVDAQGTALAVYALLGEGPPSLWRTPIPSTAAAAGEAGIAWIRVPVGADTDAPSRVHDAAIAAQLPEAPLSTMTDHYLQRLLLPSRFAPRHLCAARLALLPATAKPAGADPASLRALVELRLDELEAGAEVGESFRASSISKGIEQTLGESLLYLADSHKAADEALCLGALVLPLTDRAVPGPPPMIAILTGTRLGILQPQCAATLSPALQEQVQLLLSTSRTFAERCVAATSETLAALSPGAALVAAEKLLSTAVGHAPALPPEAARRVAHLLAAARQLVALVSAPSTAGSGLAAARWHENLTSTWRGVGATHASPVPAANGLAAFWTGSVASIASQGASMCRHTLVLLLYALRQQPVADLSDAEVAECREGPDPILPALSRVAVACELLACLACDVRPISPALGSSALEQLLSAAPLPISPMQPFVDTASSARALLSFVWRDVLVASASGAEANAISSQVETLTSGMAGLLCSARLWRPLESYLRRLSSPSPLHEVFSATAALRARRYEMAAISFRAAVSAASGSGNTLRWLLRAVALPEIQPEVRPPSPGHESVEWDLYQYAAAVWRTFKQEGQTELVIAFARPTLDLPTLRQCAPHQCAALAALVFSTALALGRTVDAHAVICTLHAHAAAEREAGRLEAASVFAERTSDTLRALVSTLHKRGALHVLTSFHFDESLAEEVHVALLWHARATSIAVPTATVLASDAYSTESAVLLASSGAYEVPYAMKLRKREYLAAAACLFELSVRLNAEWRAWPSDTPPARLLPVLRAEADALSGTLAAIELLPAPLERAIVEHTARHAEELVAALHAARAVGVGAPHTHSSAWTLWDGRSPTGALLFGGALEAGLFSRPESVEAYVGRFDASTKQLRATAATTPAAASQRAPVQATSLRQRRALALARASLAHDHSLLLSVSIPTASLGSSRENDGVLEAVASLQALLRASMFDEAAELSANHVREMWRHMCLTNTNRLHGLPLVAHALGAHCIRLDVTAASQPSERACRAPGEVAPYAPGMVPPHWRRLRAFLQRHDCAAIDFSLGAAAATGALCVERTKPLPRWLAGHVANVDDNGAPTQLRVSAGAARADHDAPLGDSFHFAHAVGAALQGHPVAGAQLIARGPAAWGGDATVAIPRHAEGSEARNQSDALEVSLRTVDPGSVPLCRNPGALCRALLDVGSVGHLLDTMRVVRIGCEAIPAVHTRWVSCGLIDRVHVAVARAQGVAPWEADGSLSGPLQPELSACFDAIEAYLEGGPSRACHPLELVRRVSDAVVDCEWDGEAPRSGGIQVAAAVVQTREQSTVEAVAGLLEVAVRR